MPDLSTLAAHLTESTCAKIPGVHGNGWGALRAAISFQRANSESVFEGLRRPLLKLLRSHQYQLQTTELLRLAPADVCLKKRRSGQEERHGGLFDKRADRLRIEGIRMKNYAHPARQRQHQRAGEAE